MCATSLRKLSTFGVSMTAFSLVADGMVAVTGAASDFTAGAGMGRSSLLDFHMRSLSQPPHPAAQAPLATLRKRMAWGTIPNPYAGGNRVFGSGVHFRARP